MKIYYIRHHEESLGPYSKQELRLVGIKAEDYIWTGGLGGWKQAKDLPELKDILVTSAIEPITFKKKTTNKQYSNKFFFPFRSLFKFILKRLKATNY
ncbi:MAG: DUF4339 domain-containing protein [Flavisolibacter sp.]